MLIRNAAAYLALALFAGPLRAQSWAPTNAIPVAHDSALSAAWAGGLTNPQFSAIDLDLDGWEDLLVFDRQDGVVLPFLHSGAAGSTEYTFAPELIPLLPSTLHHWVLAVDYDGDGRKDLFCGTEVGSNVQAYRNVTAMPGGPLSFARVKERLISSYPPVLPLYSAASDIPAIADLDGDGDLDFLTFDVGGSFVEWHRNTSRETYGHSDSLAFAVQSNCFGHFQESSTGCDATLGLSPCGVGQRSTSGATASLHAGSTMLSYDMDQDGLLDLVVGDVSCHQVYAMHNGGTPSIAHFDFVESAFPSQGGSIDVQSFPAVFRLDWDHDGLLDLIAAPNTSTASENRRGVQWLRNTGGVPANYSTQGYGHLQDEMMEWGTGSHPAFLDYDRDGLLDLIVGDLGAYDSAGGYRSGLHLYRNTGSSTQAAFRLVDRDYLGLSVHSYLSPTAGDLDGDGDQDLIVGTANGMMLYFQNTASSGPANFILQSTHYLGLDVGLNAMPCLHDLDGDQDLDLFVGNHRGYLHALENTGSATQPSFSLLSNTWGDVKINDATGEVFTNGYGRPAFLDVDHDQDVELIVGGVDGKIAVFENPTLAPSSAFVRVGDLGGLDLGSYATPAVGALGASHADVVVGCFRGGLWLVQASGPNAVAPMNVAIPALRCAPNPSAGQVLVEVSGPHSTGHLVLMDVQGRVLGRWDLSGNTANLELDWLEAGAYILQLRSTRGGLAQTRLVVSK